MLFRSPFPRRIGIVTSPQAAALRDVLTTLARRAPQIGIVLYPTLVQGEGAGQAIACAIEHADSRAECDVLIVCRGGGSIEDLWAFNEEIVARAIRACATPVICGVGHETDFTIADFAADQRAPTPTAAAELVAPERNTLLARLAELQSSLRRQAEQGINQRAQQLDWLGRRLQHPSQRLEQQGEVLRNLQRRLDAALQQTSARGRQALTTLARRLYFARPDTGLAARRLDALGPRLRNALHSKLQGEAGELARLSACLTHLNPEAVLSRGYSIVSDHNGKVIRDCTLLEPGEKITVKSHRCRADALVTAVRDDEGTPPVASPRGAE